MRVKVGFRSSSREQYGDFCRKHKDIKLSFDEWKAIIYGFNYDFRDYILTYGDKAKLPFGFGDISIIKRRVRKTKVVDGKERIALPIDWKKTKEKGKYIYNFNYHTQGWRFKWIWWCRTGRFKLAELWNFKPSRVSSRKITEYLSRTDIDFIDVYKEWRYGR